MGEATWAFVDVETSGLDPSRHEVWEVGMYLRKPGQTDEEWHWFLPIYLSRADQIALDIGKYHERYEAPTNPGRALHDFAAEFASLTWGAHLVGANPAFDAGFLAALLRNNCQCPGWKFRLVDVEAMAFAYLPAAQRGDAPTSLAKTAKHLGVAVDESAAHTALGDAKLAMDCYDAMTAK